MLHKFHTVSQYDVTNRNAAWANESYQKVGGPLDVGKRPTNHYCGSIFGGGMKRHEAAAFRQIYSSSTG